MERVTRTKFICDSKTIYKHNKSCEPSWEYSFSAVTSRNSDESEENKTFWKYTPSGTVKLHCVTNDLIEVGQTYYLDFIKAD